MRHRTSAPATAQVSPTTLPGYLARWAAERGRQIAIRHKRQGVWVAWTWEDLQAEVARVAATLAARGFGPADVVAIAVASSPAALALTLAAQGLGGAAIWVGPADRDPSSATGRPETSPPEPTARFGFARDEAALADLQARFHPDGAWRLGLHAGAHGAQEGQARAAHADADPARPPGAPLQSRPSDVAFLFAREGEGDGAVADPGAGRVSPRAPSMTQAAVVAAAQAWLEAEEADAGREAFSPQAPTTEAAATFIAGWLVGGFPLGLPEDATTADADRRELEPTVVAATATEYGRLWQQITDNLPLPGTLLRAIVDAGLAPAAGWLRRALSAWLVRRPLRRVLGLRRVATAFVLGASPLPAEAGELLARLGIFLRALPLASRAPAGAPAAPFSSPEAGAPALFEPALVLSSSPSAKLT